MCLEDQKTIVLMLFRLIIIILLLMTLEVSLMSIEPSVGVFSGAPFEGPICNRFSALACISEILIEEGVGAMDAQPQ
jgi:hypothetical protein